MDLPITAMKEQDCAELATFLEKVDHSFRPTLSSRIEFRSFAVKVLSKGVVLKVVDEDKVVAVTIFYANDQVEKTAYLSVVAVLDECRGRGIGKRLVAEVIQMSRSRGMRRITVQMNPENEAAVALYTSLGFRMCGKPNGDHVRADSIFMDLSLSRSLC